MRFLLDTNILSNLIDEPYGAAARTMMLRGIDNVVTSIVCSAQMLYGLAKLPSMRHRERVIDLLATIPVLAIEAETDRHYGSVRAALEKAGTPIGQNDIWIAAHALALDLTLITDNMAEFARVPGLRVENWLRA